MNNVIISLKRFLQNKNTVTVLGVIAIITILYFAYNYQVKQETEPVRIYVAKETIQPRTLITDDMVETKKIPKAAVTSNVIRTKSAIVGKYSNYNTTIPAGSMFYTETVISEDELPDSSFTKVKDGEIPYNFSVTIDSTYGNSIYPGNIIDIYMKAVNDAGEIMVGKLLENIEVLDVIDKSGNKVFENTEENRTPATLIFGVSSEIHILLRKASYMKAYSVELFPVPHGGNIPVEGDTAVSSQQLKDFIESHTVANDELIDETTNTTETGE
ncbi:MAG: SAF domain-containing protein [Bacilli bacterium]|nr:SAF domain-containing protein [Bacilli bacterium]